ncbi:hypothetical protein HY994_00305 [Candidatus Micrarchaeota archaeon]|nr:hypothetical protein [Candidatus Micrarchaeota archaeon]
MYLTLKDGEKVSEHAIPGIHSFDVGQTLDAKQLKSLGAQPFAIYEGSTQAVKNLMQKEIEHAYAKYKSQGYGSGELNEEQFEAFWLHDHTQDEERVAKARFLKMGYSLEPYQLKTAAKFLGALKNHPKIGGDPWVAIEVGMLQTTMKK